MQACGILRSLGVKDAKIRFKLDCPVPADRRDHGGAESPAGIRSLTCYLDILQVHGYPTTFPMMHCSFIESRHSSDGGAHTPTPAIYNNHWHTYDHRPPIVNGLSPAVPSVLASASRRSTPLRVCFFRIAKADSAANAASAPSCGDATKTPIKKHSAEATEPRTCVSLQIRSESHCQWQWHPGAAGEVPGGCGYVKVPDHS